MFELGLWMGLGFSLGLRLGLGWSWIRVRAEVGVGMGVCLGLVFRLVWGLAFICGWARAGFRGSV